jgi:hypothetical protein
MYCICCKKDKVIPYSLEDEMGSSETSMTEEEMLWLKGQKTDKSDSNVRVGVSIGVKADLSIDYINTNNGIIQTIDAGYGSRHDTDKFVIAICDDCIDIELNNGNLLFWGNYFSPNNKKVLERIEKSKKLYRRNKNLDKLI